MACRANYIHIVTKIHTSQDTCTKHCVDPMSTTKYWLKITSFYLFFPFELALERERRERVRTSTGIRVIAPIWQSFKRYIYPSFILLQSATNLPHTLSLNPSRHSDGMQTVLSNPEHSCKLSYAWLRPSRRSADHGGFQPYYRCEHHSSHWLPQLPWWE